MPYFDKKRKKWKGVVKRGDHRLTHAFQTKTDAKTWEVEKSKELECPTPARIETGMDLLTVSNGYLDFCKLRFSATTYGEKKKLCQDILRKWGNVNVSEITPAMVMKHLEARARKVSDNAWNRDRKNLLAMFNWIRKIHGVTHNPVINIDRLPEQRKVDYIPPAEDIDRVMMACEGQDRVMLQCYYFTFARRGEIFNWGWDDINFEKSGIVYGREKDCIVTCRLITSRFPKIQSFIRRSNGNGSTVIRIRPMCSRIQRTERSSFSVTSS